MEIDSKHSTLSDILFLDIPFLSLCFSCFEKERGDADGRAPCCFEWCEEHSHYIRWNVDEFDLDEDELAQWNEEEDDEEEDDEGEGEGEEEEDGEEGEEECNEEEEGEEDGEGEEGEEEEEQT